MSLTALAVFCVYALGLVSALVWHPIFALLSYLWIFYNDPSTNWWGAELPAFRYSLFAASVALVATLRIEGGTSSAWNSHFTSKLLLAYVVWLWIQTVWAIDVSVHLDGAVLGAKYLALLYIVNKLVRSERALEVFLWAHVVGCFIFSWIGFASEVGGRLETVGGPGVDDANLLAAHLTTGLIVAGYLFISMRGILKWIALGAIPFILNGIILTQSRGAFIALIATAPVALYLTPRSRLRVVWMASVLGGVLFLTLANQEFWDRIGTVFGTGEHEEIPAETRTQILGPQLRMFVDHPMGVGHRGNELLSPNYMPSDLLTSSGRRSAHNTFMASLVDQGLPGASLLVGIWVSVLVTLRGLKALDKSGLPLKLGLYRAAVGASLASCFVSGLFLNMLKTEVQVWLIGLLAVLVVLSKDSVTRLMPTSSG